MAIAFNLPSEREASEENFSRLNRLLSELYEVLCHILVSRQPTPDPQSSRRDRPFSEADAERPFQNPESSLSRRRSRPLSAAPIPLPLLSIEDLEDDVFSSRNDARNDIFSTRKIEIFGRLGFPRTPAGVLLTPRRERIFSFSVPDEKHWIDKGGTDEFDGVSLDSDTDEPDAPSPAPSFKDSTSSDTSLFSSMMPDKISGSICTAVLFMIGWKLLRNR